jgi:hypothetical protein
MTHEDQYEEYTKYSKESENRLVEKIRKFGVRAELESRQNFPDDFNEILTRCKNKTAKIERSKPDILILTLITGMEQAVYVECKTRIPTWYNSPNFTVNVKQIEEYKEYEKNNKIHTIISFEDPNCTYMDFLDLVDFGEIHPGKNGSGDYYNVDISKLISLENFFKNIDERAIMVTNRFKYE